MICNLCNTEYDDELERCPSCGAPNPEYEKSAEPADEPEVSEVEVPSASLSSLRENVEIDDEVEQASLVPVFRSPNETVTNIVKGLLESEGVPVTVASRQIPWFDGVMTTAEGFYADLLVPESEADRARMLIEVFRSAPEQGEEQS